MGGRGGEGKEGKGREKWSTGREPRAHKARGCWAARAARPDPDSRTTSTLARLASPFRGGGTGSGRGALVRTDPHCWVGLARPFPPSGEFVRSFVGGCGCGRADPVRFGARVVASTRGVVSAARELAGPRAGRLRARACVPPPRHAPHDGRWWSTAARRWRERREAAASFFKFKTVEGAERAAVRLLARVGQAAGGGAQGNGSLAPSAAPDLAAGALRGAEQGEACTLCAPLGECS